VFLIQLPAKGERLIPKQPEKSVFSSVGFFRLFGYKKTYLLIRRGEARLSIKGEEAFYSDDVAARLHERIKKL